MLHRAPLLVPSHSRRQRSRRTALRHPGGGTTETRRQADGTGAGHGRSWQPARTVPQRCYFEDALPLRLPPGPALAALDHCLHGFVRRTVHQARQVDAPACALTERVQLEVSEIWPGARLACYGSRATGLACASSDVDLVVLGVPGFEGPPDMQAQLHALAALQARLERLPGVTSACIQKSAVPIVTLTAASAAGAEDLHLDISLHTPQHLGLLAAQHVRQLHLVLPALQPLLLILKQLLLHQQLKATYTGGLSSYALTVMTARAARGRARGGTQRAPLAFPCHGQSAAQRRGGVGEGEATPRNHSKRAHARIARERGREGQRASECGWARRARARGSLPPSPACSEAASPGLAKCTVSRPR